MLLVTPRLKRYSASVDAGVNWVATTASMQTLNIISVRGGGLSSPMRVCCCCGAWCLQVNRWLPYRDPLQNFNAILRRTISPTAQGNSPQSRNFSRSQKAKTPSFLTGFIIALVLRAQVSQGFASSFPSIEVAEKAVSQAIKANRSMIRRWAKSTSAGGQDNLLRIEYTSKSKVGIVVSAANKEMSDTNKFRVILLKEVYNNKPYYVLTAYPIK